MQPIISIITATLNADKTFSDTASSIREQTQFSAIEWLISDGGSTDNTLTLIKDNSGIIKYWHSQKDTGIYNAWNTLLPKVNGEWVLVLGADDCLTNNKTIENLICQLQKIPNDCFWVYAQVNIIGNSYHFICGEEWKFIRNSFYTSMKVPHQGVLVRKKLFDNIGCFAEEFKIAGDFDFMVRAYKQGFQPVFIPQIIVNMQAIGISTKPKNGVLSMWELFLVRKKYQIFPLYPIEWIWMMFKAVILFLLSTIFSSKITSKIFSIFQLIFDKRAHKIIQPDSFKKDIY